VACGILTPPLIIVSQQLRGLPLYLPTNGVAMLLLTLLATVRFQVMATATERAARREAILSRYAADLLAATDRDQLFEAARRALGKFARTAKGQASLVFDTEHGARESSWSASVTLRGQQIGKIVADADPATLRRWRESLTTIATELSIALERDLLLATERETAESLSAQNARLRELDAMKDRFVSAVTHELRTPLTSMVGYLELLREGEAGELNAEQAHMVGVIERSCHRLNELIGEILVTAQLDSGRVKYNFTQVDIARLASKHVESIKAIAEKQGLRLQLIVESQPPTLQADEMRLGQVIDNLLSNAVKFTPEGGTITVTVAQHGDAASLKVRDTGAGMPPNELDMIFDRFYRTTNASTTAGTGLGLWIAQKIAKAHGGLITVTSELDVGTTFDIQLPLSAADRPMTSQQHEVRT
jgi:signal transduction histidine kinase